MKILLIQPPVRDFYQTAIRTQPIGLAYLAAALQQKNHTVEILDCQLPGHKKPIPVPANFPGMRKFFTHGDLSPFRLYSKYFHFGLSFQEIAERIRQIRPEAVGISCQFSPYFEETIQTASIVKSIDAGIPVILGGAHVSCAPEEVLQSSYVDYVIIGEGEETLPQLIDSIQAGAVPLNIDGTGFKVNGTCCINPRKKFIDDLDRLRLPARDLLNPAYYKINGRPYTMLLTSRGCPQNCSYCSVGSVMGNKLRVRSPENIIDEIRLCLDAHGISLFDIEDDNFTLDPQRALAILDSIIDEFGENTLKLLAMNGLSIISLNRQILQKMKRAGFQYLDLALGSVSVEANRKVGRPTDPAKAEAVLEQAGKLKFPVTTYIILGVPGHSLMEIMDSILYLMERLTFIGPSIFYPSPGTKLYEELRNEPSFSLPDYPLLRSSLFPVETARFSRLDMVTLLRLVRWINFIKGVLACRHTCRTSLTALRQEAVSNWWPGGVPKSRDGFSGDMLYLSSSKPLKAEETGKLLTAFFLHWENFYGIRRLRSHNKELYTYQIFPYKTSSRVMQLFEHKKANRFIRAGIRKKSLN